MTNEKKVRIVVDDSAVTRNILKSGLSKHPGIEVVATAGGPYEARDKIVELKPDLITLDLEMPRMNGLEFITVLMKNWPIPIVILSALVERNCETSLKALELGAVEVVSKPKADIAHSLPKVISKLGEVILSASKARIRPRKESHYSYRKSN